MNKKTKAKRIAAVAAVVIILGFIWGHSLMPRSVSAGESGGLRDWIYAVIGIYIPENMLRKIAHITEFAALGAAVGAVLRVYEKKRPSEMFSGWTAGLIVSVADEALQLISERGALVTDILIDFAGYSLGFFVCLALSALSEKRRASKT